MERKLKITQLFAALLLSVLSLPLIDAGVFENNSELISFMILHVAMGLFCLLVVFMNFNRNKTILNPLSVSFLTIFFFYVFFFPFIISDGYLIESRPVVQSNEAGFTYTVFKTQIVVLIAIIFFYLGASTRGLYQIRILKPERIVSSRYFLIAALYVVIGVFAITMAMDGLPNYISKMLRFWERSEIYDESQVWGGYKWRILITFLNQGLFMLMAGKRFFLGSDSKRKYLMYMFFIVLSAFFLNSYNGGRGAMLTILLGSIVLLDYFNERIRYGFLIPAGIFIVALSFVLGMLREFSDLPVGELLESDLFKEAKWFVAYYLSNVINTLWLVYTTDTTGYSVVNTIISPFYGLFGGETPPSTQSVMWDFWYGSWNLSNPRYGFPGELYFNFGFIGVATGMAVIGGIVGLLTNLYQNSRAAEKSVSGGLVRIYAIFTAHFIVIANSNYLPEYFIFFSVPFYMALLLLRNRIC